MNGKAQQTLGGGTGGKPRSATQADDECAPFQALHASIDRDLRPWEAGGANTTLGAVQRAIQAFGQPPHKGITLAILNGTLFVANRASVRDLGQHGRLVVAYVRAVRAVTEEYGGLLPDSVFVISTFDRPQVIMAGRLKATTADARAGALAAAATAVDATGAGGGAPGGGPHSHGDPAVVPPPPVMRFCTSHAFADIAVPSPHFYMKNYSGLLSQVAEAAFLPPWPDRTPAVFGRFSPYTRFVHIKDTTTRRVGVGGVDICKRTSAALQCPARKHFMTWVQRAQHGQHQHQQGGSGGSMQAQGAGAARTRQVAVEVSDLSRSSPVPLLDHARYKYLVHLDGQTCSSRLEQLLALGSLVLKEESGYYSFYHHLLQPDRHYLPFWHGGQGPEDFFAQLAWARANDADARRIAQAGQALAATFLGPRARACFWRQLLTRYGRLLGFNPGAPDVRAQLFTSLLTADDFLEGLRAEGVHYADTSFAA